MKVLGEYFQQQTSVKRKFSVAANLIKGVWSSHDVDISPKQLGSSDGHVSIFERKSKQW